MVGVVDEVVPVREDAPVLVDAVDAAPEMTLGTVARDCPPDPPWVLVRASVLSCFGCHWAGKFFLMIGVCCLIRRVNSSSSETGYAIGVPGGTRKALGSMGLLKYSRPLSNMAQMICRQ